MARGARVALVLAALAVTVPLDSAFAALPSADYRLVYADEFDGTALDTMKWNYNYPWGNGHTHNHIAWVVEEQVKVSHGRLNIQAIAQKHPEASSTHPYTSGTINTSGKLNITHGFIEGRMKMADIAGTWPAFWMLQGGWPPEIDIMEFPRGAANANNQYWANWHYTNSSGAHASEGWQRSGPNFTTGYNEFAVEWTPTAMKFYLNGALMNAVQNTASISEAANMYLILNQAVGGWAGTPPSDTPFPSNFEVDWVRVWQKNPAGDVASAWNVSGGGSWDARGNWTAGVPRFSSQVARFGRVGAASIASVTWNNSRTVGGIEFSGGATGTTTYNLGASSSSLQFANTTGGTPFIEALATTTAHQGIGARIELWETTQVRNHMAATSIFLTGAIVGSGGLLIDGPGTVVLSNANSYAGGTEIDTGTQGPGVLRANASGALGSGGVIIGVNGNATTARLEIAGSRLLANNIDLRGRTNNSVAIENVSGANTLAGTITANVGGNIYQIQSDAGGTLTLSGAAAGATAPGVALQAASGERIITLQGAGDGVVSGIIRDGVPGSPTGTKLAITKAGAGTWTLDGANTYTGATNVTAGKLLLGRSFTTSAALSASGSGVIELAQGGARVMQTPTVSITGAARIDLKDNKLITDTPAGAASGGVYAAGSVQRMVQTACADGAWSGEGSTTSMPHATSGLTTIAVLTGAQYGASTFAGQSISPTSTIAMYTYGGDSNLE